MSRVISGSHAVDAAASDPRIEAGVAKLHTGVRYVGQGLSISSGGVQMPYFFAVRDFPSALLGSNQATSGGEGGETWVVVTATVAYTVPDVGYLVQLNPASTPITVTIPAASAATGGVIIVKDIQGLLTQGRTVTIVAASGNIDGAANYAIGTQDYQSVTLQSDGSNWFVV